LDPLSAIKKGATYIIIGRPITKSKNPKETLKLINEEIKNYLKIFKYITHTVFVVLPPQVVSPLFHLLSSSFRIRPLEPCFRFRENPLACISGDGTYEIKIDFMAGPSSSLKSNTA